MNRHASRPGYCTRHDPSRAVERFGSEDAGGDHANTRKLAGDEDSSTRLGGHREPMPIPYTRATARGVDTIKVEHKATGSRPRNGAWQAERR
jgi:hypothetical protein